MIRLGEEQVEALREKAASAFPQRVLDHWQIHHPRLLACFTGDEVKLICANAVELGMADPDHSEASVVLGADLWLHELARRRGFKG